MKIVAFVKDDEIYAILSGKRKSVAKIWHGLEKYYNVYKWASEECKIRKEPIDVEWRKSKP